MTDRETELRRLTTQLQQHELVDDAFLAKSFTDRLLILDVRHGESIPDDIEQMLANHELHGAEGVYGDDEAARSFAGEICKSTRHHFVDVQTRGTHQSYVVD